jgi:hypothetical protein
MAQNGVQMSPPQGPTLNKFNPVHNSTSLTSSIVHTHLRLGLSVWRFPRKMLMPSSPLNKNIVPSALFSLSNDRWADHSSKASYRLWTDQETERNPGPIRDVEPFRKMTGEPITMTAPSKTWSLGPLEHCGREFESYSRHGFVCILFCICVR